MDGNTNEVRTAINAIMVKIRPLMDGNEIIPTADTANRFC